MDSKTNELMAIDVPNVDVAIEQWDAYQKLCKGLLNDSDYQEITIKEKDETGNYVKVKRHFKKKSAWQKLSRAFNVDTSIVYRELERTKTGRIKEAYYCIRATLPNGRSVESDALCSRTERGKDKVSDHTIMSTAKTRATNRAISELIGAGEVSSDEMTAEYRIVDDSDQQDIAHTDSLKEKTSNVDAEPINGLNDSEVDPIKASNEALDAVFKDVNKIGESKLDVFTDNDPIRNSCFQIKLMLESERIEVTKRSMRERVIKLVEEGTLLPENREPLIKYIYKHCPEELD